MPSGATCRCEGHLGFLKKGRNAPRVRVRDEHLTELFARQRGHQGACPVGVDLVEDVVEQQDGTPAHAAGQVLDLGQTQGEKEGLLLPLAAKALQRVVPDAEQDIVLVDARRRTPQPTVVLPCRHQGLCNAPAPPWAQAQADPFSAIAQALVNPVEFRLNSAKNRVRSAAMDSASGTIRSSQDRAARGPRCGSRRSAEQVVALLAQCWYCIKRSR